MQVYSSNCLLSVFVALSGACGLQHLSPGPVAGGETFTYNDQSINISTLVPYFQCLQFSLLPVNLSIFSLHLCLESLCLQSLVLLETRACMHAWMGSPSFLQQNNHFLTLSVCTSLSCLLS